MGICIMGTHAKRIGLGYLFNDLYKSYRDEEVEATLLHLHFD